MVTDFEHSGFDYFTRTKLREIRHDLMDTYNRVLKQSGVRLDSLLHKVRLIGEELNRKQMGGVVE